MVRLSGVWLWLSLGAALLAAAGSAVGLWAAHTVYGRETAALADAAAAQDVVNLLLVAPLLVVLGVGASRGSWPAYFGWSGCVAFTAYNYAIYVFSVQFGPLFLVWVAVLGLSVFALVGGLSALGKVRWVPPVDVNRIVAGGQLVGLVANLLVRMIVKHRAG